jgi:hypothetical protein
VSLGGASPLSPTIFVELKPQQTGTRLLIGYGEVATTSGSTTFLPGRLISRTSPFEGERGGASPSPTASFRSVVKQDHIWPTPRNRRGSSFPSDHLPRGVIRSASVSETERPEAKPGEAANSQSTAISTKNKHPTAQGRWLCAVPVCQPLMNILTKATVLVLNRNWQAINVRTPQEAFCMMATNVATALEIEGEDHIRPVNWEEWIKLPIRDQDEAVHTVRGQIRVPTVIVAVNCQGAQESPEALRQGHPRARWQPLPVNWPCTTPERGQPGPRCSSLAWRQGRLGKPHLVGQGSEPAQGRPPAARGGAEAALGSACAEGVAGFGAHSEHERGRGLETVPQVLKGVNKSHGALSDRAPRPLSAQSDRKRLPYEIDFKDKPERRSGRARKNSSIMNTKDLN